MSTVVPPRLPDSPEEYTSGFMDTYSRTITSFFNRLTAIGQVRGSALNLNVNSLPTEADVATLRSGDVYRDSTASNVLKIKV